MTSWKFFDSQGDLSIRVSDFVSLVENDVVEVLPDQLVLVGDEATVAGDEDALRRSS